MIYSIKTKRKLELIVSCKLTSIFLNHLPLAQQNRLLIGKASLSIFFQILIYLFYIIVTDYLYKPLYLGPHRAQTEPEII